MGRASRVSAESHGIWGSAAGSILLLPPGFSLAGGASQGGAAGKNNSGYTRPEFRCSANIDIGTTTINALFDTGASGGNCIDKEIMKILPPTKAKLIHTRPAVCVGINKLPVRSCGEVLIEFNMGYPARTFKASFAIIENLIHPLVIGLPFLRENRAILDLDKDIMHLGDSKIALRQNLPMAKPPPLHVAAFESTTLPPWSKSLVKVYLKGTGRKPEEMNQT